MSVALPAYAYSPVPSYASLPRSGDSTIEYTPRAGQTETPLGNLTKQWRDVTVIFKNQNTSSDIPTYRRNSSVCGEIGLEHPESILTISLKLEGRINLSSSDCGSIVQKIVEEKRTLWDHAKSGRCPSVVGFALPFPATYKDEDRIYRLPPTYETICLGSPLLVVKCTYKLSIIITKMKSGRLSFWKPTSKTYPIHVAFKPRTRPARPTIQEAFFSTFKAAPSEWHQMVVTIPPRRRAAVEPISCHFVIPSVQTFCLSDDIPFHIQLSGCRDSLQYFYGSGPHYASEPLQSGKKRRRQYAASIRVYLARQIYVEVNGRQSWRTITVGEGTIRAIPPAESFNPEADSEVAVDWEGAVRCKSDVTCASFNINHLVVKDFIIFALTPANVRTSPLLPISHAHPIRLVTDGWTEQDLAHPQDR
ncbi:hypothetical protein B0H19DRAFT_46890 [Mycena capillaripes]|nr:hypothetical protein B0H19DRAFT_46890 [Mycena capillaripes]